MNHGENRNNESSTTFQSKNTETTSKSETKIKKKNKSSESKYSSSDVKNELSARKHHDFQVQIAVKLRHATRKIRKRKVIQKMRKIITLHDTVIIRQKKLK